MSARIQRLIGCTLLVGAAFSRLSAAEHSAQAIKERPFVTFFTSSINKFHAGCESIFKSVDRPDLYTSLDQRLDRYNDFSGIDRDSPVGMMFMWSDDETPHVIFVPVKEVNDLMTTATFGVTQFRQVKEDQYELDKAGTPYHVIVSQGYAYFADAVSTIRNLRITPQQLTRNLRDRYDMAVHFDLRQIPRKWKSDFMTSIRKQYEPILQAYDGECAETANLRRAIGGLTLDLIERAVLDTETIDIGLRLDPETRHLQFDVVVDVTRKSPSANALDQLFAPQGKFACLNQSEAAASLVMNLTTRGLVQKILGTAEIPATKNSRLETGIQLSGDRIGELSLIAAMNGSDADAMNNAFPGLLAKLEESGYFERVEPNFDSHLGVTLHSLIPRELPAVIAPYVGSNVEVIAGQTNDAFWIGIGPQKNVLNHLQDAIDLVDEYSINPQSGSLVGAQVLGRKLPELLASNIFIPNTDAAMVREVLERGDDGITLKVDRIPSGLKMSVDFDEGFVRLIGRDWIRQIDFLNR